MAQETSAGDLRRWAQLQVHCSVNTVGPVQAYVGLLNQFAEGNHPFSANIAFAKRKIG
jgi:hypothetical protein